MTLYTIQRIYFSYPEKTRTIATGLTLAQAQAHCKDPETSSSACTSSVARKRTRTFGMWFDSYAEHKYFDHRAEATRGHWHTV